MVAGASSLLLETGNCIQEKLDVVLFVYSTVNGTMANEIVKQTAVVKIPFRSGHVAIRAKVGT